ncbi:uncharacterized protein LOC121878790 [Homarus americanus]|uniref:Zinc finger FYVE domain-containing protein 26-like n=1 Tax=Homarus americanus TaxID=6706 RepID=A0A8J5JPJ9_HOMAM|nr:uncharacterized protein LOC121878790 [Homarus americanus]KAG7158413.1 Zinc finger FYVE domain-containing protein 26-like [Homarus americanus]
MSSNEVNCGPLLRCLFQNDYKIYKELDAYLCQDGSVTSEYQLSLSLEACTSLKEKLLSHPQEAAFIFHHLVAKRKQIKAKRDAQLNSSSATVAESKATTFTIKECQKVSSLPGGNKMGKIFIESLDHCLWRIENLDEKLQKEVAEYSALLKRQQKSQSPRRSILSGVKHRTLESVEVSKLKERKLATNVEKLRNEALFYKIFSLSGDVDLTVLSELFSRILRLCYERNLLATHRIHFSILSSSRKCLELYCTKEEEYLLGKSAFKKNESIQDVVVLTPSNIRELYYICTRNSEHILKILFEVLVNNSVTSMKEIEMHEKSNWLIPLWPLMFIQTLSTSHDQLKSPTNVAAVWEKHSNVVDPTLMELCSDLSRDMNFVSWCLANNSRIKAIPLLQLMRDHSPLYALYKSLQLNTLISTEVLEILTEHCMARDSSGELSSFCTSTYIAYCILSRVFEVIGAGMQLDIMAAGWQARGKLFAGKRFGGVATNSFQNRQAHELFYVQNIAEKLEIVQQMLGDLQPLEYRLEIMENIYSLLFVNHSDMSDEGQSESGGEEGELERSYISQQTDLDSLASTPHTETPKRPRSPQKSSNPASITALEKDGDPKRSKVLNFSEYVVIDEKFCGAVNLSSKPSNASSLSEDIGQVSSSSTDSKNKDLHHVADTQATAKLSESPCVSEQLQWDTYQNSSQSCQTVHPQSSCAMSGKSTGSSISELPRTGYLINTLVAWDIMLLLRDSLLAFSAQLYSQNAQQTQFNGSNSRLAFDSRITKLSRCVNEGLWRLQVMAPGTHKFASPDIFDHYLDGTLLSDTAQCLVYENSPRLESVFQKTSLFKVAGSSHEGKKRLAKDHEPSEVGGHSTKFRSIINFLFAPPSSLITLALANGNADRIQQIFLTYKVPDIVEKREAHLVVRLNELRPKLSTANQKPGRVKETRVKQASSNSQDILQNIGLLAREGSAQVGATNLIYDLVTSSPPPVPKGMPEAALETGCPVMTSFLVPQALVLSDLALTVDVSETTATYLIEQALQRQTTHSSTHDKHHETCSGIQGYIPVLQQLGATCSAVTEMKKTEDSGGTVAGDITEKFSLQLSSLTATPYSLLLTSYPLQDVDLKNYIKGWSRVLKSMCAAQEALMLFDKTHQDKSLSAHAKSLKNQRHQSYKMLLHVLSEEAPHLYVSCVKEKPYTKLGAFVRSFYQYLQLLSSMIIQHADKHFQKNMSSYFSLLTQRPVHILGSLMFKEGVDPVKLEPIAARMRLNLTTMILQYCCPKFTISRDNLSRTIEQGSMGDHADTLGFKILHERVILNASAVHCQASVYGEVVVRDILMTILSGLREIIQPVAVSSKSHHKAVILNDATAPSALLSGDVQVALRDTADLAAVDFKKMVPGNEAVAFFINLVNLMFIHAGVLNHILYPSGKLEPRGIFSKHQLERIMAMKRLGYMVGQLGFLSLYDILYNILSLHNPLSSILIQSDIEHKFSLCESDLIYDKVQPSSRDELHQLLTLPPKISFCITQGTPVSPRVEVLYADRMEEQIHGAVHEHLRIFLFLQDNRSSKSNVNVKDRKWNIFTSRTILNYLALHADGVADGIHSLQQNAPDDVVSTLQKLESELSKNGQPEIIVLDKTVGKGIVLEFSEECEDKNLVSLALGEPETSSVSMTPEDSPWLAAKVPLAVLTYLRRKCPLLAFIVQAFHSMSEVHKNNPAWVDDTIDMWLSVLYPPSLGVRPPAEEAKVFRAIKNLFSIGRHKSLARIYKGNKVTSALSSDPDVCLIWNLADELLGSGAITKSYSTKLHHHVSSFVTVLQALPTVTLEKHPDLKILLDHLLVFLVQTTDSAADPPPWMFAHQISDCDMRFAVSMENHRNWLVLPAIELLSLIAHDTRLKCHEQKEARKRAEQIEVYNKILMLGNSSHKSWQEVELMSNEKPAELLQYLIQKKQFKLGVQWADYHNGSAELRRLVDQSYLMDVLDKTSPEYNIALEALNAISLKDLMIVMKNLLQRLSNIPTRRFLIEVFLKRIHSTCEDFICNKSTEFEENRKDTTNVSEQESDVKESNCDIFSSLDIMSLQQEVMGLILVEDVGPPAADRFQLSHLASAPHLIIEQWLMNIRLDAVGKSIKVLAQHLDMVGMGISPPNHSSDFGMSFSCTDTPAQTREIQGLSWDVLNWLLEVYAAKALDTTGVQLALKPHLVSDKSPRKFVMPSQPPKRNDWVPDAEVRRCPVCEVAIFSMFCRRHHCRRCGRVVCSSCSQHRNVVQGYDELLVRVCADCYQQTKELNLQDYIQVRPLGDGSYDTVSQTSDAHGVRRRNSWTSDTEGGWYLSTDTQHNDLIRQEFCYDYAPSLSLCLAILALHQDHKRAAVCTVKLCHHLFSLIISSLRAASPETDHSFVLSMIQTLLTSSKVRFGNIGELQGIGLCEYYTQWVDLLSILLKANCDHIIPREALENMLLIGELHQKNLLRNDDVQMSLDKHLKQEFFHMRRLRDTLVKEQMWELALDVSTKAGLETNGVWGAWALASLKAGDFPGARERFSRVLERPSDKNRPCNSPILPEVIKYLESNPFRVDQQVMDQADRTRSSIMLSDQSRLPPSQALVVLHSLKNLHRISQGNLTNKDTLRQVSYGYKSKKVNPSRIQSVFQVECKYYLNLYGNHLMTIQYFMRNNQVQECVEYLLAEEVHLDVFIETVLLPCLRCGHLDSLMRSLNASDPHMEKWANLMFGGCRWLERRGWWNCLLALQEALGDRLRASMTLLKMYSNGVNSYTALSGRSEYVVSALTHLQAYLDSQALYGATSKRKKLILDMSPWHVNQNINMLKLQTDVTKFLAGNESRGNHTADILQKLYEMKILKERCLPTLLVNNDERLAVAILVICGAQVLADGLNLAYRIVERSELPVERLLSVCCQLLMQKNKVENMSQFVRGIQEWEVLTLEAVDAALQPVLQEVAANTQNASLDVLVKLLSSDKAKMEAFIECGRLKSAYLVAVHRRSCEDVKRVQEAASLSGQVHIAAMCNKWLINYQNSVST